MKQPIQIIQGRWRTLAIHAAAWAIACRAGVALADEPLVFNRDIRPILAENCFACHGPDSAARKADLRLDKREVAAGMNAIVPGNPDGSESMRRVFSDNPDEVMPPPTSRKQLSAEQKETLKRWIAAGAEYQPHWSLIAPQRPSLPAVKNAAWVRSPLDRFVLARLEAAGLEPAPEADRRTLSRRLSLDLTGLPPAAADVEAFVDDSAPDAYERYVDRLLASPDWGEHRGRYWLDAARYADSNGIHFDNYREIWAFREWAIGAFNRNLPFDRFTIEQLAGDLLPDRTLEEQIGSGFNRCNITTSEGGTIPEEYLVLYTRDRTETTAAVWMGLTANCSVCHDHKFDPLSQREFYEMAAFFNNTTQPAMDGNVKDTPPIVFVPPAEARTRWDALTGELAAVRQRQEDRRQAARGEFDQWLAKSAEHAQAITANAPTEGLRLHARLDEGAGASLNFVCDGQARKLDLPGGVAWQPGYVAAQALQVQAGGTAEVPDAGDFDKDQAFSYGAWVRLTDQSKNGALFARMDDMHDYRGWDLWLQNGRVGAHLVHKWPTDALKVVAKQEIKPNEWHHVFVSYDGSAKAAGVKVYIDGIAQETTTEADALQNGIRTEVPLKLAQRHSSSRVDGVTLQDLRLYGRALAAAEVGTLVKGARAAALLARPADRRTEAESKELFDWWLLEFDQPHRDLAGQVAALEAERQAIESRGSIAHVMQEKAEPPTAYILFRGEYDKRRDQVSADTPDVLPPFPAEFPRNRLGFAQWLLRPEQPLTARVTVNRFWQEVFGTGIVRTAGDFGVSGELPTHPELLDWLAIDFREGGWDIKRFFRTVVTSATYRQAAVATPAKLEKDPQNRLFSRGPRFRMDAEMVRDYALGASGLLVRKLGGPSVRPYQPEGVWEAVAMIGSNTRDYVRDKGEGLYRRSLYTFWKRSAPPASMEIFNAPSREVCAVRRERTNTPLQALVTLNDPQFIEAARVLAQKALKEGGDTVESRLNYISLQLMSRPWRPEEAPLVQASLNDLLAFYQGRPEDARLLLSVGDAPTDAALDPAQLAAWTMLTNEIFNLDEVLNK